ncbi:MAG: hypothetical protein QM756_19305 [Polyangiaceae bacterium]
MLSSKRTGMGDLYWQRRPSATADFPELLPLSELNQSDAYESDPFLSADHGTLFFASTRSGQCDVFEVPVLSYPPL